MAATTATPSNKTAYSTSDGKQILMTRAEAEQYAADQARDHADGVGSDDVPVAEGSPLTDEERARLAASPEGLAAAQVVDEVTRAIEAATSSAQLSDLGQRYRDQVRRLPPDARTRVAAAGAAKLSALQEASRTRAPVADRRTVESALREVAATRDLGELQDVESAYAARPLPGEAQARVTEAVAARRAEMSVVGAGGGGASAPATAPAPERPKVPTEDDVARDYPTRPVPTGVDQGEPVAPPAPAPAGEAPKKS